MRLTANRGFSWADTVEGEDEEEEQITTYQAQTHVVFRGEYLPEQDIIREQQREEVLVEPGGRTCVLVATWNATRQEASQ